MKRCFSIDRSHRFYNRVSTKLCLFSFFIFFFSLIKFFLLSNWMWFIFFMVSLFCWSTHEENIYFSTASLCDLSLIRSTRIILSFNIVLFSNGFLASILFLIFFFTWAIWEHFTLVKISGYYRPYLLPDQLDFRTGFPFNISPDHQP